MQSEPRDKVGIFFDATQIALVVFALYYQELGNVLESRFYSKNQCKTFYLICEQLDIVYVFCLVAKCGRIISTAIKEETRIHPDPVPEPRQCITTMCWFLNLPLFMHESNATILSIRNRALLR